LKNFWDGPKKLGWVNGRFNGRWSLKITPCTGVFEFALASRSRAANIGAKAVRRSAPRRSFGAKAEQTYAKPKDKKKDDGTPSTAEPVRTCREVA
jgi:hypothetical protein